MNTEQRNPADEEADKTEQNGEAEGQASTEAADETKPADTDSGASER